MPEEKGSAPVAAATNVATDTPHNTPPVQHVGYQDVNAASAVAGESIPGWEDADVFIERMLATRATSHARRLRIQAAELARKGYRVFPARVGRDAKGKKKIQPLIAWKANSSSDPAVIGTWSWAEASRICIDCVNSAVAVVDLDEKNGKHGLKAWAELQDEHGHAEPGATVTTKSGGRHLFFAADPDRPLPTDSNTLAPGIDTRGAVNGMVVVHDAAALPPVSRLPLVPRWVIEVASQPRPVPRADGTFAPGQSHAKGTGPFAGWSLTQLRQLPPGHDDRGRNWLFAVAGHLARKYSEYDHYVSAARLIDQQSNDPISDDDPSDFEHVLDTVWAKEQAKRDSEPPHQGEATSEDATDQEEGQDVADEQEATGPADDAEAVAELKRMRAKLLEVQRQYLDLPDPGHVDVGLAAAATAEADDHAKVWLLIVGSSSSGKTETGDLTTGKASAQLDDVSVPGLLGWVREEMPGPKGKNGGSSKLVPGGALLDLPRWPGHPGQRRGLLVFSDLSNLLAASERGGQDKLFAFLRVVYDGRASRTIGQSGGEGTGQSLTWQGRVTIVAACTKAIDNYSAHAGELGPRWVYFRLAERSLAQKRAASRKASKKDKEAYRKQARELATRIITLASSRLDRVELSDELSEAIEDALLVTGYGRASVPRSGYGSREVLGMPDIEEPGRLTKQLTILARGLLALGLDEPEVTKLVRKAALDSMPETRAKVLRALATADKPLTTYSLAKATGMSRTPVKRHAEDLELIGVVDANREGPEPAEGAFDMRKCSWALEGEGGDLIRDVLRLAVAEGWR